MEDICFGEEGQEIEEIASAMKGREYWLQLKKQFFTNNEIGLIIVRDENPELVSAAIRLFPIYLKRKYLKQVVVVSAQELVARLMEGISGKDCVILNMVEPEVLKGLLDYYKLVQFFSEIVVISLEEPYGNSHIIGKAGITMENYVKDALYV